MILLSSIDGYAQLIGVLLIFVFVLMITAFVTRYIGSAQKSLDKSKNIEILETKRIAPNKYIQIIRVGNHYIAVSVGQNDIHMLCEIDPSEIKASETKGSFSGVLQNILLKEKAKDVAEQNEQKECNEEIS